MTSIKEFQARVDGGGDPPLELDSCLRALWLGRSGDWEGSHDIVNDISTPLGSWIHAWLHRVEGDLSNANYWYRLAARPPMECELEEEWRELVGEALSSSS